MKESFRQRKISLCFLDRPFKGLDTLNHNLLIAKLVAYGFETDSLRYMKSYLTNRIQRVRVKKHLVSGRV